MVLPQGNCAEIRVVQDYVQPHTTTTTTTTTTTYNHHYNNVCRNDTPFALVATNVSYGENAQFDESQKGGHYSDSLVASGGPSQATSTSHFDGGDRSGQVPGHAPLQEARSGVQDSMDARAHQRNNTTIGSLARMVKFCTCRPRADNQGDRSKRLCWHGAEWPFSHIRYYGDNFEDVGDCHAPIRVRTRSRVQFLEELYALVVWIGRICVEVSKTGV
jgi:hypothetical protein